MQLRTARLCLDCEELHDEQQCPICASEAFASISRWVPAPERRGRSRPMTSRDAEVYRRLLASERNAPSRAAHVLKQGALGLTAAGLVAAWVWRNVGALSTNPAASIPKEPPSRKD